MCRVNIIMPNRVMEISRVAVVVVLMERNATHIVEIAINLHANSELNFCIAWFY